MSIKPYDQFPNDILSRLVAYLLCSPTQGIIADEQLLLFKKEINDRRELIHLPYVNKIHSFSGPTHIFSHMQLSCSCCDRSNALKFTHIIVGHDAKLEWNSNYYCKHKNQSINEHTFEEARSIYYGFSCDNIKCIDDLQKDSLVASQIDIDKFIEQLTPQQELKLLDTLVQRAKANLSK